MKVLIALMAIILLFSSCRKCSEYGFFIAPMYVRMSPVPQVRVNLDTINFIVDVPFNAYDVRDPNARIPFSLEKYKPFELSFSLTGEYYNDSLRINPPVSPVDQKFLGLTVFKGKMKVGSRYSFDFERGDTSWQLHLKLIPLARFEGLIRIRFFPTGYRDRCIEIGLQQTMTNTPQSHHLVNARLIRPFEPHISDIFFYVE